MTRRLPRGWPSALVAALVALVAGLPACSGGWLGSSSSSTTVPRPATQGSNPPAVTAPGPGPTAPGPTTAPVLLAPTAPPTTELRSADLRPGGPPPWSAPKIAAGVARQVALEEWGQAANKSTARVVLPADVFLSPTAMPRRANFSGGWAVAWDDPGKPGVLPSGEFCESCGRGVAGMAATGAPDDKALVLRSPIVVQWNDGAAAGYAGPRPTTRQFLATLFIPGQRAAYEVWSYISQVHLENLIAQLRFVEGGP